MTNSSTLNARQQEIMKQVNKVGSISIKDAAVECRVSEATIRRDLDELTVSGLIERVHGGAMRLSSTTFERYHSEKMKTMLNEKRKIASYAASLVENGDSIFLDSGTTTFFLAHELVNHSDLTVITNNLDIAYSAQFNSTSTLIVTGGMRRDNYSVLIGDVAENTIKSFKVDKVFMGCDAISPKDGIYNSNFLEIGVKKQIVLCGKKVILVTDSSKFHRQALAKVCNLSDVDMIITDDDLEENTVEEIKKIVPNTVCVTMLN